MAQKKASPQTQEELRNAKENLAKELREKKLTGIPSQDKAWTKNYTQEQLAIETPKMSMYEYIYNRNIGNMSVNAFDYMGKKITYEEMFYRIEDTAKRFKKFGVKEKDYINLALPISPETVYMIYGLDYIGAAACLIDPRVNVERMQYYLDLVSSNLCGITGVYASVMRHAIETRNEVQMININPLQSFGKNENTLLKSLYSIKMLPESFKELFYNLFNKSKNRIITSGQFYKEDISDVVLGSPVYYDGKISIGEYTSGTTGIPKGLELGSSAINLLVE